MENRIYNFNPGPAMQPLEVLQEAQAEFLNFAKSGMSIIEISHRSKQYEQVHNQAKADIKELMGLGDDYEVLETYSGKNLEYKEYEQLYPPFEHGVSILDLIFNTGEDAYKYLKSTRK